MIRLTGGFLRGREIAIPKGNNTRPTQAKLRQALFNSIQFELDGAKVLDLFSGSGSLGIEALSRGATEAVFFEQNPTVVGLLEKNLDQLNLTDNATVFQEAVSPEKIDRYFENNTVSPRDLVFIDPPYDLKWEHGDFLKINWSRVVTPQGKLIIESSKKSGELLNQVGVLVKFRDKTYGDTRLTSYVYSK
jgi:16S rRNA (guanine966-N2)-methyltransferase